MPITTNRITKDNINVSKYLLIINDDDDSLLILWISVLINEDMLIKKETVARIFPIIQGKRNIDKSCLIYDCGCALTAISSL
jgi:hypothetical protein